MTKKTVRASTRRALPEGRDLRARERMASNIASYRNSSFVRYPRVITLAEHRACLYLLSHGMTFGAEFGYSNAPEIARQHRASVKAGTRFVR